MPYLTVDDYLDRFTIAEATRITDETKSGQPDVERIETAIADAGEYADSFLAKRYVLPISPRPAMLVRLVADLARENLHGTRVPEAVERNADKARKLLLDLSAGRATIGVPAGEDAPAQNPSDVGVVAGDRRPRVFGGGALDDFVGLGMSGGGRTVFDGPRGW